MKPNPASRPTDRPASGMTATATIEVRCAWPDGDGPTMPRGTYSSRLAKWHTLTVRAPLPVPDPDTPEAEQVGIEGSGRYVRQDGAVGAATAEMRYGRLVSMPEPWRSQVWAALTEATR